MDDYRNASPQAMELSHEDRISALEERLRRLDDVCGRQWRFVCSLARKVGMDVPKEL